MWKYAPCEKNVFQKYAYKKNKWEGDSKKNWNMFVSLMQFFELGQFEIQFVVIFVIYWSSSSVFRVLWVLLTSSGTCQVVFVTPTSWEPQVWNMTTPVLFLYKVCSLRGLQNFPAFLSSGLTHLVYCAISQKGLFELQLDDIFHYKNPF